MARILTVSYKDTTTGIWTDFINVQTYFPNVTYVDSPDLPASTVKGIGENLTGIHGVYPDQFKLSDFDFPYHFLVRSVTSEADLKNDVMEFMTWVYNQGVVRLSYYGEPTYRNYKYRSSSTYYPTHGKMGYDAYITVNMAAVDPTQYQKVTTSFTNTTSNISGNWGSYNITIEETGLDINPTITFTNNTTYSVTQEHPHVLSFFSYNYSTDKWYGIQIDAGKPPSVITIDTDSGTATVLASGVTLNLVDKFSPIDYSKWSDLWEGTPYRSDNYVYGYPRLTTGRNLVGMIIANFRTTTEVTNGRLTFSYQRRFV